MKTHLIILATFLFCACATQESVTPTNNSGGLTYEGIVLDPSGNPVEGARVRGMSLNKDDYGITYYGDTQTDESGKFTLTIQTAPDTLQISYRDKYGVVKFPKQYTLIEIILKKKKS